MRVGNIPPTVYFVFPCYNESEVLEITFSKICNLLHQLVHEGIISDSSRGVFVDDGSIDVSWRMIRETHKDDLFIEGIRLSKNKGHQIALFAGIEYAAARADLIISMDADLQQDIGAVTQFISMYEEGYDVVNGIRESRSTDGVVKKTTARVYYSLLKIMGCGIIKDSADFRMLSQKAAKALVSYKESNIFLRGLVLELGFKSATLEFEVKDRVAGETKYTFRKMLRLALDGITSFSVFPIRVVFFIGIGVLLASIIMITYALVANLRGITVPGWTSLSASLWFLGGLNLIGVGIVGEYIGRIYFEAKRRPRYLIDEMCVGGNEKEGFEPASEKNNIVQVKTNIMNSNSIDSTLK